MEQHGPDPAEITPAAAPKRNGTVALFREIFQTVFIALLVYIVLQTVISPFQVDGASMNPTLENHERVLVNRLAYAGLDLNQIRNLLPGEDTDDPNVVRPFGLPERGDVVVLNPPTRSSSDEPYIKRVIGLPGDAVTFRQGYVHVHGERLVESYIDGPITTCKGQHCDIGTIPPGYVYVLGDNRDHSSDSRAFGLVSVDHLLGKAFFANWPLDMIGPISGADYEE